MSDQVLVVVFIVLEGRGIVYLQCIQKMCMFFFSPGPSACQLTAEQEFLKAVKLLLSDPSAVPQLSSMQLPQCDAEGGWRQVQCSGPPETAFE